MIDVTLHQLRVFREVAAQGTMAAAAESLGYTPSAISQAISAMEKVLGHNVVERVGRSVQLTDLGRELLVHTDHLLAGLERAEMELERAMSEPRGEFSMGVFESFALTLLPPLLTRLEREHPDLAVRTRESAFEFEDDVLRGSLDLAFAIGYPQSPVPLSAGLTSEPVLTERFWLVAPTDHAFGPGPVALADLADHSFIAPPPTFGCGRCIQVACRTAGFEAHVPHLIEEYTTAIRMVGAGLGIALIPDLGLSHLRDDVEVLPLREVVTRDIKAVYRESSEGRPALGAVLDAVKQLAGDVGAGDSRTPVGS